MFDQIGLLQINQSTMDKDRNILEDNTDEKFKFGTLKKLKKKLNDIISNCLYYPKFKLARQGNKMVL